MPVIARFQGITIKMYFLSAEHNPPHIHAFYADYSAAFAIENGEVIDGVMPRKIARTIAQWIKTNKKQLLDLWATQELHGFGD